MVSRYKPPFSEDVAETVSLDTEWPRGIISLSHVALPFAPEDPLCGRYPPEERGVLFLGELQIRGERGLMKISNNFLLRLRYNPFFPVMKDRIVAWLEDETNSH